MSQAAAHAVVYNLNTARALGGDRALAYPLNAWGAGLDEEAGDSLGLMGARMSFGRDAEIFGEGEAAEFLYRVVSGAVRTYRILSDGRRQIGEFHLPGDIFGLEAGSEHLMSAEALTRTEVLVYRRTAVFALAVRRPAVAQALWGATARDLERAQAHLMLLGRKSACERVASFLLALAERQVSGSEVNLPMSRQDMADYLGLTIETVSRAFTQLQADGLIALKGCRCVTLRNRAAFQALVE